MISLPFGSIIMLGVLAFALSGASMQTVLNAHSIVLVIVGTVGVLALSTPSSDIAGMFRSILDLRKGGLTPQEVSDTLIEISRRRDTKLPENAHPLARYAQELWDQGVEDEIFAILMSRRLEELYNSGLQAVASIRNLAKYPPALGMTGTVIGLVSLFSGLTPDKKSQIGPMLAMAMTATFYGLILANVILMPLSDRLYLLHLRQVKMNEHTFQVLMLINRGEPTSIIQEELNGAA